MRDKSGIITPPHRRGNHGVRRTHTVEVLRLRQELLGADHPDTLDAMHSLGILFQKSGRLVEALAIIEQVLLKRNEKLGAEHPDTLNAKSSLAVCLSNVGRLDEAFSLCTKVLHVRREKFGENHPTTLDAMNNMACLYWNSSRPEEALRIQEEVVRLMRDKFGGSHPDTLRAINNLAVFYGKSNRLEEALMMGYEVRHLSSRGLRTKRIPYNEGLFYNMIRWTCLSGDQNRAKDMIRSAINECPELMDEALKDQAMRDPDLEAIRDFIAAL